MVEDPNRNAFEKEQRCPELPQSTPRVSYEQPKETLGSNPCHAPLSQGLRDPLRPWGDPESPGWFGTGISSGWMVGCWFFVFWFVWFCFFFGWVITEHDFVCGFNVFMLVRFSVS